MERLFFVKDAPSADPPVSTEQITPSPAFFMPLSNALICTEIKLIEYRLCAGKRNVFMPDQ